MKPGCLRDGWAESTLVTTAKGLDVQLRGHAMRLQERAAHVQVTAPTERMKSNEKESSTLTASTVDGDYVLDFCSERDYHDRGCSKTNEAFLVVING